MLSFENYSELLHQLNRTLSAFLSIEKAMLNCGLRSFDFDESTEQIQLIENEILHIKGKLYHHIIQPEGSSSINTALIYIDNLLKSISQLCSISAELAKKANGGKYGFFAYRKDLKIYKNYEKTRESYGTQLNNTFSCPW
jgi:uncharacterized protein Yka (UPF0111/DUF47 family)